MPSRETARTGRAAPAKAAKAAKVVKATKATKATKAPKLAEAASHGQPIVTYHTRCAGFEDYRALAGEVLAMEASPRATAADASGPRLTSDGVVFSLQAPEAHRVQLVGDFNGWTADDTVMQPAGPVWSCVLKLEPGRYRYRYIVDGQWQSDPLNEHREPTPFGGDNSVLELADNDR